MNKQRPVYLDLRQIQFPVTATASILHRVAGVVMFGALAVLLWLLATSLQSEAGFQYVSELFDGFFFTVVLWAILTVFAYHLCAGIRHMMMDMGYFEDSMENGNKSAQVCMVIAGVLSLMAGIWLW